MNDFDPKDVDEALDEAAMATEDRKELELPEAPASMTLRVWIKGYGVMLTARDNKVSDLLKKTITMVDYAESHGWKNTWEKEPIPNGHVSTLKDATTNVPTPNCSIHGTPMEYKEGISKKSNKPYAFWACSQKLADGSWCNGKPME